MPWGVSLAHRDSLRSPCPQSAPRAPTFAATLNESSSRSGIGFRSGKLRSILVVTEMALALILVIGAALLIRTFRNLQAVDPGFDPHNVLTMAMSISGSRFQKIRRGRGSSWRDDVPTASRTDTRSHFERGRHMLPAAPGRRFGLPFDIVGRPEGRCTRFTGGGGY